MYIILGFVAGIVIGGLIMTVIFLSRESKLKDDLYNFEEYFMEEVNQIHDNQSQLDEHLEGLINTINNSTLKFLENKASVGVEEVVEKSELNVNQILDKINNDGFESLTKEEIEKLRGLKGSDEEDSKKDIENI